MKENVYDKESFFEKYGEMLRSKEGLKGAGEWPTLEKILPDLKGNGHLIWDVAMDGTACMQLLKAQAMWLVLICLRKCYKRLKKRRSPTK